MNRVAMGAWRSIENGCMEIDDEGFRSGEEHPRRTAAPDNMRERVDAFDWTTTPLGPRANWPSELKIAVRQMLDSSFPKAVVWGKNLTTIHNDAFLSILGAKPDALGRSFADIWSEVWETIGPMVERAYAGIPTYIEDFPLTIERSGPEERAWFTFCYSPLRMADGSVTGMLDTVVETTGKMRAQAELALVNAELGHRLKNTLTLVQAIAGQTLRGAAEPEAMEAFSSRLAALAQAHDILLRQNWSAASFYQIVVASIEPHDALGQVAFDGPDLHIGSRAAVTLSLMLNELATNAIKYGALSRPTGKVALFWKIDAGELHLCWHETGGPKVSEPIRVGFGSRLIDMGLGGTSTVERRYEAEGLKFDVRVPWEELAN
ncbi:sensor histidine kinase [Hephaestia sp. GCM10023244]|uniref:sensor histidine kinase n=1 Tax=unclassified Hephaestia TaxID=2631281 RepID=UPI0020772A20|nr:hypothetical protein [Hephaestia sp. MAHUQ-44]